MNKADDNWHYESDGNGPPRQRRDQYVVESDGSGRVCTVHGPDAFKRAHLISATPKLLKAAEEALRCICEYDNWPAVGRAAAVELLQNAIKKARSEGGG